MTGETAASAAIRGVNGVSGEIMVSLWCERLKCDSCDCREVCGFLDDLK